MFSHFSNSCHNSRYKRNHFCDSLDVTKRGERKESRKALSSLSSQMLKMNELEIIFVDHFIRKEKRERSILKLRSKKKRHEFLDKFNHDWEDMLLDNKLVEVKTKGDGKTFLWLQEKLKWEETTPCYCIAYVTQDRKILPFQQAFDACQASGYAGLLIGAAGKRFYLKTEQVKGQAASFIGIA